MLKVFCPIDFRGRCWRPRQQLLFAAFFSPLFAIAQSPEIVPTAGQTITQSCRIALGEYRFEGAKDGLETPVLTIKGDGIEVDFQGATFDGSVEKTLPDQFSGLGIKVEGRKISIKNLKVRGYKIGLLAAQVVDFQLVGSDFSYNWRPRLHSRREKEVMSDWLSYHQNDHDEWLRYGAGIYLKDCPGALVKNCTATGNQNALMLAGCDGGLFYNNDFRFNSGIGIGLYRSSKNRVMHNRLNWNVRGPTDGAVDHRGQGSAAIVCQEQSGNNVFAYNSATHSGNGFYGGNVDAKKPGEHASNGNLIFGNDFSYAPAAGIEMTISSNRFWANYMDDCDLGILADYSFESEFGGNTIRNCRTGIAIERGKANTFFKNSFENDSAGVLLEALTISGSGWGSNSPSREAYFSENKFSGTRNPLGFSQTEQIWVDSSNLFEGFQKLLDVRPAADSQQVFFVKKLERAAPAQPVCPPLLDGIDAKSGIARQRGRHWIWMTEWGPYDFRGPICFLKKIDGTHYEFWMNAAGTGNWQVKKAKGFKNLTMTGGFPTKIIAERNPAAEEIYLQFEAVFQKEQTDAFGKKIPAGQPYLFDFQRFEP